jgi:hypothetical protein
MGCRTSSQATRSTPPPTGRSRSSSRAVRPAARSLSRARAGPNLHGHASSHSCVHGHGSRRRCPDSDLNPCPTRRLGAVARGRLSLRRHADSVHRPRGAGGRARHLLPVQRRQVLRRRLHVPRDCGEFGDRRVLVPLPGDRPSVRGALRGGRGVQLLLGGRGGRVPDVRQLPAGDARHGRDRGHVPQRVLPVPRGGRDRDGRRAGDRALRVAAGALRHPLVLVPHVRRGHGRHLCLHPHGPPSPCPSQPPASGTAACLRTAERPHPRSCD